MNHRKYALLNGKIFIENKKKNRKTDAICLLLELMRLKQNNVHIAISKNC